MKTIVQNFKADYCSEIVEQNVIGGDKIKFKIVAENGNCYSKLTIYILNQNGLQEIANKYDIPGYRHVDYVDYSDRRLEVSKANVFAAEDWIKKVFK